MNSFWFSTYALYLAYLKGGGGNASGQSGAGNGSAAAGAAGAPEAGADAGAGKDPAGDPDRIPLYAGTITGWRAWDIADDGTLLSVNDHEQWPAGKPLEMVCAHGHAHTTPDPECTCGIYSLKSRELLIQHQGSGHGVIGTVALWGRVLEHDNGIYRAQRAYPTQLWLADRLPIALIKKVQKYGAPIVTMEIDREPEIVPVPPPMPNLPAQQQAVIVAGVHLRTISRALAAIAPIASTTYDCPLPLGTQVLQLELSAHAEGIVQHVQLADNGGRIYTDRPLCTLPRSSSGGYLVFDGLIMTRGNGTGGPPLYIETRLLTGWRIRLTFGDFSHAPLPIWVCSLELLNARLQPPPTITNVQQGF